MRKQFPMRFPFLKTDVFKRKFNLKKLLSRLLLYAIGSNFTVVKFIYLYFTVLKRKVTICPLEQISSGENVVSDVPDVIPLFTAQQTAAA